MALPTCPPPTITRVGGVVNPSTKISVPSAVLKASLLPMSANLWAISMAWESNSALPSEPVTEPSDRNNNLTPRAGPPSLALTTVARLTG